MSSKAPPSASYCYQYTYRLCRQRVPRDTRSCPGGDLPHCRGGGVCGAAATLAAHSPLHCGDHGAPAATAATQRRWPTLERRSIKCRRANFAVERDIRGSKTPCSRRGVRCFDDNNVSCGEVEVAPCQRGRGDLRQCTAQPRRIARRHVFATA